MPRYIDADAVKGAFQDKYVIYDDTIDIIDSVPTADVKPIVKGEWRLNNLNGFKIYDCSNCGIHMECEWTYCPHCGARMDGAK